MESNLELLKKSLLHNNPNLFIGAGFSLGANNNTIPNGRDLSKKILSELLNYSPTSEEFKQLKEYSLPKICSYTTTKVGKDKLYQYLQSVFQNINPAPFHFSFSKYPWSKIFSTNIDDVVENVYTKSNQDLIIQNSRYCSTKINKNSPELFKLHGCVNNIDEGIIFDEEEYINSLLDIQDYRFGVLAVEIQNKDFIFVGSNYDDFNIKYYLNLYASTTFTSARGKLFFINPYPNLMFESEIEKIGGILLKYTTEDFAKILEDIAICKESMDEVKLEHDGYINIRTNKLKTNNQSGYNSDLFIGAHPQWTDIFYDWDIRIPTIEKEFTEKVKEFETQKDNTFVYTLVGKGYSGKSVILKRLSNILLENNYETISYEGKSFNSNQFANYIKGTSLNKYALVIDDGSYLYNQIEYLRSIIDNVKLVVIISSRPYFHSKRKYGLLNCYHHECFIDIKITDSLSKAVYDKINEKGYLGVLAKIEEEEERLSFIKSSTDISSAIFEITNGKDFKQRFRKDINDIIRTGNFREVLIKLSIFDLLELPYFPKELLVNIYKNRTIGILKRIDDIIRVDKDKTRFKLKNYYLTKLIQDSINSKEILNNLKELLVYISPYVENTSSSYWNEMQSVLMRDKLLKDKLKVNQKDLKAIFYEIKDYYSNNYNYWLQLGIAEQLDKDYEKALNHFTQAEALGPKSYMVKNAIGRNYILQAINENNTELSQELFDKGREMLFQLIDTKEEFQVKAYSIHTYITGLIRYYSNKKEVKISKSEIAKAKSLLDRMLEKDKSDPLFNQTNQQFSKFLIKSGTGRMLKLNSIQDLQVLKEIESVDDDLW